MDGRRKKAPVSVEVTEPDANFEVALLAILGLSKKESSVSLDMGCLEKLLKTRKKEVPSAAGGFILELVSRRVEKQKNKGVFQSVDPSLSDEEILVRSICALRYLYLSEEKIKEMKENLCWKPPV